LYKFYDKNTFLQDLRNVVYDADEVDDAVNLWCTLYSNVVNQHAPIKTQRTKALKNLWLTSRITHDRDFYHKKAAKSKCSDDLSKCRELKYQVNIEIKS
jgi:hypothetical protein